MFHYGLTAWFKTRYLIGSNNNKKTISLSQNNNKYAKSENANSRNSMFEFQIKCKIFNRPITIFLSLMHWPLHWFWRIWCSHLRKTPPSKEAFRHSGGERRRWTSPTVTLYLDVELRSDRRPGTEQKTSFAFTEIPPIRPSLFIIREATLLWGTGTVRENQTEIWAKDL